MKLFHLIFSLVLLFSASAKSQESHESNFCYPINVSINTGGHVSHHQRGGYAIVDSKDKVFAGQLLSLDTIINRIENLINQSRCSENTMESCIVEGKFLKIGIKYIASFATSTHAQIYADLMRYKKICL